MQLDRSSDAEQTVTIELAEGEAHRMSADAFRQLGAGHVAYVRPGRRDDGSCCYAIFRGDGTAIELVAELEGMIECLERNQLLLVAVH